MSRPFHATVRQKPMFPMSRDQHSWAATAFHLAVDSFIKFPDVNTFNYLTEEMAIINAAAAKVFSNRKEAVWASLFKQYDILQAIYDRQITGSPAVATDAEAKIIIGNCKTIDPALKRIPWSIYQECRNNIEVVIEDTLCQTQTA